MLTRLIKVAAIVYLSAAAAVALAQTSPTPDGSQTPTVAPVNAMCPIGKEPIVQSAGTVEYKGNVVGLCCPSCAKQFLAWDEARKDKFIALAIAHKEPGQEEAGSTTPAPIIQASPGTSFPYTLDTCPVSGSKLGSMGDPIVRAYDGHEVRFCCNGCIKDFEANQAKYWSEIDTRIVEQQLMHYPLDTCIVSGKKLDDSAVNLVYRNRLVRLASADAVKAFQADTAKHLAALDKRIVEAQLSGYPMTDCPVGGPLGSMGDPVNFIYMNRLVRFCCSSCEPRLVASPQKFMAKLDKAYADAQRASYTLKTCPVSGAALGSMGDPVELVAGTRLARFCCDSCIPKFRTNPEKYLAKLPQH